LASTIDSMGLEVDGPRKVPRLRKKAASILPKDCKLGDGMDTPPLGGGGALGPRSVAICVNYHGNDPMNEWVGTQKNGNRFTRAARVMLSFVEALGGDRQAHDDRQEGEQALGVRAPEIQTRRVSGCKNFLNWCILGLCIIFGGPFSQKEYAPFSEQKNFTRRTHSVYFVLPLGSQHNGGESTRGTTGRLEHPRR